nr:Kelch repeat-containing protein [Ipomoea batatas]
MEDPLASVSECGEPTSSQKEKLRTCPFARGSEIYPDLSDSLSASATPPQSESTAIQMVSLPDSVSAENEEFQTPPEQAYSSSQPYLSGSEDLRPPRAAAAFGYQSDSPGDKQAAPDEDGAEHQGIVDLGTDCDDLGFSEPRVTIAPEGSDSANGVRENDFNDSELFKGSKRIRFPEEDLGVDSPTLYVGETEPTAIEIIGDESVNPDGIDLECEEVAREKEKKMVNLDSSVNVVVGYSRAVCENGNSKGIEGTKEELEVVNSIGKAAKEKEKCNDVANEKGKEKCNDVANEKGKHDVPSAEEKHDSANTKKCRRELPLSIKGGGNEETRRRVDAKNLTPFKDIMVGLEALLGKADDGRKPESLLETAEKCGWVFPKPRWWPPEGFDD